MQVRDLTGRLVQQLEANAPTGPATVPLNVPELAVGVYLIETTVVIPLCVADSLPTSVPDLNPSLTVLGQGVVLNTAALGPVPNSVLRHPLGNLSADKNSIQTALDTLFGGY